MSSTINAETALKGWLEKTLSVVPSDKNLIYCEWNEGPNAAAGRQKGRSRAMIFSLFGLARKDVQDFDPEDPDHLEELADLDGDIGESCVVPLESVQALDLYELFERVTRSSATLRPLLSRRVLAFGEHEGGVKLLAPRKSVRKALPQTPYYYELHVKGGANTIEDYEAEGFDETPLLDHDRVRAWPKTGIKLFLQKKPRLLDFLHFYRDWLVCTERATQLLREATDKIQVFPAPLYKPVSQDWEKVEGYCVVNLYEKLDCLDEEDVLPPDQKGEPKTFDPVRGYKIKISATRGRQVFRINYEYFRLVVSQDFRDRLEQEGITGLEWLRRRSVP